MQTIRVSATKARNEFFDLLNLIALGNTHVVIEKDSKPIVVMAPKQTKVDWKGLKKAMDACHGILKDFDLNDSPLRGKRSKTWLKRASKY